MDISIPYVNFPAQWADERAAITKCFERVMEGGVFIGGDEVEAFERDLAALCQTSYAVALNSGTDALRLGMIALGVGPGDEVITPANSFIASTSSVVHAGAIPVFCDVLDDMNLDPEAVVKAISPKTKAIMAVHLSGRMARMELLSEIASRHHLLLIEDAAQAIGSRYHDRPSGSFGHIGCFSMHPLKNLNAAGDAGAVVTNDIDVVRRLRLLRNHGLADRDKALEFGFVSRMDALQAGILRHRLLRLDSIISQRRKNADLYRRLLDDRHVFIPPCRANEFNTFHTFIIQVERREELRNYLLECGIEALVHYPVPIHLQPAAAYLGWKQGSLARTERQADMILSLPIHQYLKAWEIEKVAASVNRFYLK